MIAACVLAPLRVAVILAVVTEVTAEEPMANVASFFPCRTKTVAGTVREPLSVFRATTSPPPLAFACKTIDPVAVVPATIEGAEMISRPSKGDTVKVFCPTPDAVIFAVASAVTEGVAAISIWKVTVVAPVGTVTLAGSITSLGRLLLRLTTVPPEDAGFSNVILAKADPPFKT